MHTCPIYYPWCINNVSTFAQTCMYIQACMFVDVNNSLRPRDINPSQHRVHRQVLSMHISNKVRVHEPDVPWCTYMPALPSTLARVNRQPKRYAVLTITWMCHLHIHVSIDFNLTSWVQLYVYAHFQQKSDVRTCQHCLRPLQVYMSIVPMRCPWILALTFYMTACSSQHPVYKLLCLHLQQSFIMYIPSTFQQMHV